MDLADSWTWMLKIAFVYAGILHLEAGGGGGIRTPETLSGLTVFKTAGFNRSPTPPFLILTHSMGYRAICDNFGFECSILVHTVTKLSQAFLSFSTAAIPFGISCSVC